MPFSRNFALSPRAPKLLCTGCSGDVAQCEQPEVLGAALHKQSLVGVVQLFLCTAAKHLIPGELPSHGPSIASTSNTVVGTEPSWKCDSTGLTTELLLDLLEDKTLLQKKPQP